MKSDHKRWNYSILFGPDKWASQWKIGQKQSPVDIRLGDVVRNPELGKHPLDIDDRGVHFQVKNLGVNVSALCSNTSTNALVLSGGSLKHRYQFSEMHLHWSKDNAKGSEHTIDGRSYAAEMHLVHWNKDLYKSEEEAKNSPYGLAVLGVLLDVSGVYKNPEFEWILEMFERVRFRDEVSASHSDINPYSILPGNRSAYYTYEGSRTTPPCSENVTWIVFAEPVKIYPGQLARLRLLKAVNRSQGACDHKHDPKVKHATCRCAKVPSIADNFRPVMELSGRKVTSSV